tara:strand:+ start:383 stop:769 length:387 start_codon:yes stop_codon:yes gene_type:complete
MNKFLYKKVLIQPVMKTIIGVKSYKKNTNLIGILYTLYSRERNEIRIGYIDKIEELEDYITKNDYEIIEQRLGNKRESKLLQVTLKEIGYKVSKNSGNYIYSQQLVSHLNILGWPTGKYKSKKKKLFK